MCESYENGCKKSSGNELDEETLYLNLLEMVQSIRPGMHNIRPAGQMWPAEAFNLARKVLNFNYLACSFPKNIL